MPKGYQQLTVAQRYTIETLKARGESNRIIAKTIAVSSRTVDRELKRNTGLRGYRHKQAQEKTIQRRSKPKPHLKKLTEKNVNYLLDKLRHQQWSPMQISKRLFQETGQTLSHELIYQFVWADKKQGGTLYTQLRRRCKPYAKRGANGKSSRGRIQHRVGIEERPVQASNRERFGDWEADLIMGKGNKGALLSVVDRKSRYLRLFKLSGKNAEEVSLAITQALRGFEVKTITFDNGKEFAKHWKIGESLGILTFFADPYSSWQRGTNENTNGLVRQYFPKGLDFAIVSESEVAEVERKLNNRPREVLGFATPAEIQRQAA
jgi:IS30 family transposase